MPRWLTLSGTDVIRILESFDFHQVSQRGSHVKLQRSTPDGRQSLTVPVHREIDKGTLHAIFRQASRFIPEAELKKHFHAE